MLELPEGQKKVKPVLQDWFFGILSFQLLSVPSFLSLLLQDAGWAGLSPALRGVHCLERPGGEEIKPGLAAEWFSNSLILAFFFVISVVRPQRSSMECGL